MSLIGLKVGHLKVRIVERAIGLGLLQTVHEYGARGQELRTRLRTERALFAQFGVDAGTWLKDRVGTIHTVQGRESEAVILVLGAPKASQNGARSWAAGTPNILNVAVSRAKQRLYVVGSYGAWSGVGHARELASQLQPRG